MHVTALKIALLMGTALTFAACSQADKIAGETQDKISTKMKESTNKIVHKVIDYTTPGQTNEDHLYLEEVLGEKALAEVGRWNERSLARLTADPRFEKMKADALEILNSKDKIPYVSYRGGEVHNFWQDATHVRGIWRRSTLESYLTDDTKWETVLDFDALAEKEGKNWVYKGNTCLSPDYELCIVNLSDGGKDAVVRREFNTKTKQFVEDGFVTQESKGTLSWLDEDHVVVGVDFGEGTMTDSGYPVIAKLWKRGTPLSEAVEIGRGEQEDVGYWAGTFELDDGSREIMNARSMTFYTSRYDWVPRKDGNASA